MLENIYIIWHASLRVITLNVKICAPCGLSNEPVYAFRNVIQGVLIFNETAVGTVNLISYSVTESVYGAMASEVLTSNKS